MKFYSSVLLASIISVAAAFSAVAPASSASATGSPDPVDRSMRGIDKDPATFDPTTGDRPAVTRNNDDQVWVQQVRIAKV
jgi:ABC-type transport system substrate-binding protein